MTTYYNRARSLKGIPVGTIIPWAGSRSDIPRGFLPCSGSSNYNTKDYPLLYQLIGNVYGGTANLTFKLPNLNDGSSGTVDMYKGHFYYLNNLSETAYNACHKPEKTTISDDDFWKTIGGSSDGNKGSTSQTNWTSTIDVVGEQRNVENLVARYNTFSFVPGEVVTTVYLAGRKLGDVHIPDHSHSPLGEEGTTLGLTQGSRQARFCNNDNEIDATYFSPWFGGFIKLCSLDPSCGPAARPIPGRTTGGNLIGDYFGMKFLYDNYRSLGQGGFAGGSGFGARNTGETNSQGQGLLYDGDGASSGQMYSQVEASPSGTKFFWSSLDQAPSNNTFATVAQHTHPPVQYTFSSKYIRVINPGLVNDVRLNTVTINNETGRNFGTITANTATPGLTMIYVIRAF